jgi:O-antigen ligase
VQARVLLEDGSFKRAARKPVFGWGFNSVDRAKAQAGFTAQDVQQFGVSSTSHNSYLTVLVQYGSVGLLLLTIPWLAIGWRAIRDVALRPELRWFTVGTLGLLFVFVVDSNAGDFRYFSFVPALPWIFLGFLRRRQLAEG